MINTFAEAEREIRKLRDELDSLKRGNIDARNRRIVNMRASQDPNDGVIRAELFQFLKNDRPQSVRSGGTFTINPIWGRAKLTGVQTVGTDVLDHPYYVQLPAGKKLVIQATYVSAKTGPTISNYIVDFLVSTDEMVTHNSIYPTGNANKLIIEAGQKVGSQLVLETTDILSGSFVSVDVLQADGVVSGVEMLIRWELEDI
jgi:hypothetical protein